VTRLLAALLTPWLEADSTPLSRLRRRLQDEDRLDVVVVLGSPPQGDGELGELLEERVRAGVELVQRGGAPLLCLSGGPTRGPARSSEAECMARRAAALGVSPRDILIEDRSLDTWGNAREAGLLLLPARRRIWVVTQPAHLRRSLRCFRQVGFDARGLLIDASQQRERTGRELRMIGRELAALGRDCVLELFHVEQGHRPR
jgi:uncharacterized SAM-binding protein YcdF (DUF218 family)